MENNRSQLRVVYLRHGGSGYFHRWTDYLSHWDGKQYPSAIIELKDGTVTLVAAPGFTFDTRDELTRRMDEVNELFEKKSERDAAEI